MKIICLVCNEKVSDIWDHVLEPTANGGFWGYNKKHAKYGKEVADSLYSKPCFCGGHITQHATGEDSWETTCDNCEFLWDED